MTDITDQDQKDYAKVNRVLEQMQGYVDNESFYTGNPREWLRDLREVFPAPAPTLAEELRALGALLEEEGGAGARSTVWARDLADRVEQIEQEVAEADRDRDEALRWVDNLTRQRDEARADLADVTEVNHEIRRERDEARAEVERLTATFKEHLKEPGHLPNPADVPEGEMWLIDTDYDKGLAGVRDERGTWSVLSANGFARESELDDDEVTLVARLVPDTRRVIPHHPEGTT